MAVISTVHSPSLLAIQPLHSNRVQKHAATCSARARTGRVRAANLPAGVEVPKVQPRLSEPFLGFTKTAEVWNSRASMIGLIGVFIVELVGNCAEERSSSDDWCGSGERPRSSFVVLHCLCC